METRTITPIRIAVFFALILIAATGWYSFRGDSTQEAPLAEPETGNLSQVRPVTADDHIRGNPNAKLVFIVYSDFGCPFCDQFHKTMRLLAESYAKDGDVAWVYRHMPIIQLHEQAATLALASECVAQDAGNTAFWNFSDALFELQDATGAIDQQRILSLVDAANIPQETFISCMRDGDLMREVEDDFEEAIRAGAVGTPFTVVISPHQTFTIEGVQTFLAMAGAIENVLPALEADTILPPSAGQHSLDMFNEAPDELDFGS